MSKWRITGYVLGGLVGLFVVGLLSLGATKFFGPRQENIRRNIFENTQSYVHGKTQDLSKYYAEYTEADAEGKESIKALIVMQFADFDESDIRSARLRSFLVQMRGY